ncbi:MAG: GyrI-like domain-containing protein, partial [Bacteroidota bacterium]
DIAAFSKAFKAHFTQAPSSYRSKQVQAHTAAHMTRQQDPHTNYEKITYELETLPDITYLYIEYRGSYEDLEALEKVGLQLESFAQRNDLIQEDTVILAEIMDDHEITEAIHCRYRIGISMAPDHPFEPEGLFHLKTIPSATYARFIHQGSYKSSFETYQRIFGLWMTDMTYELDDGPILELFLNDEKETPEEDLLTAIYIPILPNP